MEESKFTLLEYHRLWREKNIDKTRKAAREWNHRNPEARKNWEKANPQRKRFNSLRGAAKKRDKEFNLNFEGIYWPTHCPILGTELDYDLHKGIQDRENSPSFDRIDPKQGYIVGNVRVVSYRGNVIKNDGTIEDHQKVIEYMQRCKNQSSLPKLLKVS